MKVIIDRFEENIAVCEKYNGELINIIRNKIPKEAKEGDVLLIEDNIISIDLEETEKRKNKIKKLTKDLWN
ncbi:MAG: DUF3006 domain-containing protein [Clostridiales bacterium]|nr:DUF3006 domain-containing protein [Clostridiales bacterium]